MPSARNAKQTNKRPSEDRQNESLVPDDEELPSPHQIRRKKARQLSVLEDSDDEEINDQSEKRDDGTSKETSPLSSLTPSSEGSTTCEVHFWDIGRQILVIDQTSKDAFEKERIGQGISNVSIELQYLIF